MYILQLHVIRITYTRFDLGPVEWQEYARMAYPAAGPPNSTAEQILFGAEFTPTALARGTGPRESA